VTACSLCASLQSLHKLMLSSPILIMLSPPHTPDTFLPLPHRQSSLTPSDDDSSIIELSFDYQFDEAGNYVRVTKGRNSSPPTPRDQEDGSASAKRKSVGGSPALVLNSNSPVGAGAAKRTSLSRSDSYPLVTGAEEQQQRARPRSFQRVVSGPALSAGPASAVGSGLRGTNRKLNVRPTSTSTSGAQREDRDDGADVESPQSIPHPHPTQQQQQQQQQQERTHRPSGLSPRLHGVSARSVSSSHAPTTSTSTTTDAQQQQRITSALPSRVSSSSLPASSSASNPGPGLGTGRQIIPGPNRAGRILMGTKYPSSTSAPTAVGGGAGGGGFDKINELEDTDLGVGYEEDGGT
jgi:hypothetical protein